MKIEKTATYQRADDKFARIWPIHMETPRGACIAHDVPCFLTMEIRDAEGVGIISAAVMLYEPEPGHGIGFITQLSAKNARVAAASLLAIADKMEAPTLNS